MSPGSLLPLVRTRTCGKSFISSLISVNTTYSIFLRFLTRLRFFQMGGNKGINKALGEIDILFTYLQDFCYQPKNSTGPDAATE